jgi:hypothetical protein
MLSLPFYLYSLISCVKPDQVPHFNIVHYNSFNIHFFHEFHHSWPYLTSISHSFSANNPFIPPRAFVLYLSFPTLLIRII